MVTDSYLYTVKYINVKLLSCTPETNEHVNYTLMKNIKGKNKAVSTVPGVQ